MTRWSKVAAGRYSTTVGVTVYLAQKHDPLTWQDRPYWTLTADGQPVVWNDGQLRGRRFRTIAEAKAWVASNG